MPRDDLVASTQVQPYLVLDAASGDGDERVLVAEGVRHRDDGLEGVTLLASGRGAVEGLIRGQRLKVERARHHIRREPVAVVHHAQPEVSCAPVYHHSYLRRDAGSLGSVERIIEELLDYHPRKVCEAPAGHLLQRLEAQVLRRPRL